MSEAHNAEVDVDAEVDGTEADKVNTGALGTLITVGLFAMISIATAVTAMVRRDVEEEQADKDVDANAVVIQLKASQRGTLNAPASYVDRGKGIVALPIDVATHAVLADLERDPNSATPPASAATAPSAAAPASAAPAESAAPVDSAKKPEETGKSGDEKKSPATKPEAGTMAPGKPAPAAPKPTAPALTPTAASPGAQAPGPLNH
jgi:hypothetical protein